MGVPGDSLDRWFSWTTYRQFSERAENVAAALVAGGEGGLGLSAWAEGAAEDAVPTVAICGPNCVEWLVADAACALAGVVSVGLHPEWSFFKVAAVLGDCRAQVAIVSRGRCGELVRAYNSVLAGGGVPDLRVLIVMDDVSLDEDAARLSLAADLPGVALPGELAVLSLVYVESLGKFARREAAGDNRTVGDASETAELVASVAALPQEEPKSAPFTLMYTSGTTGEPKGVVVSRRRWKADSAAGGVNIVPDKRSVSYMSLSHGSDRGICWQAMLCGGRIALVREGFDDWLEDLHHAKPQFLLAMAHTWTRLHGEFQRRLFKEVADRLVAVPGMEAATPDSLLDASRLPGWAAVVSKYCQTTEGAALRSQLLRGFRENIGSSLLYACTGGAHTPADVLSFIGELVCPGNESRVYDVYGASEFPGIATNGVVSESVEVKLLSVDGMGYTVRDRPRPRGEILVRSRDDRMATRYWKRPVSSAAAWLNGWYHTGDIGEVWYEGAERKLNIIDRRSNMGECYADGDSHWVALAEVESCLAQSVPALISQVCVFADRFQPDLVAVIVPHPDFLRRWAAEASLDASMPPSIASISAAGLLRVLEADVAQLINVAASGMPLRSSEIPRSIIMEGKSWTAEDGWQTVTGKLRRGKLQQRYRAQLGERFAQLESGRLASAITGVDPGDQLRSATRERWSMAQITVNSAVDAVSRMLRESAPLKLHVDCAHVKVHEWIEFSVERLKASDGEVVEASETVLATLNAALHRVTAAGRVIRDGDAGWVAQSTRAAAELSKGVDAASMQHRDEVDTSAQNLARSLFLGFAEELEDGGVAGLAAAYRRAAGPELGPSSVAPGGAAAASDGSSLIRTKSQSFRGSVPAKTTDQGTALQSNVRRVLLGLSKQRAAVLCARAALDRTPPVAAKEAAFAELQNAIDAMGATFSANNVHAPFQLTHGLRWIFPPNEDGQDRIPGISFGEAKVWCHVCGDLIEQTIDERSKRRYHCLDTASLDHCPRCHTLLRWIRQTVAGAVASGVDGADESLSEIDRFAPHLLGAWSMDNGHIIHLQNDIKPVDLSKFSPAAAVDRCFDTYSDRLALGIPDPLVVDMVKTGAPPTFCTSPLAAAAGLSLRRHDGYLWLTYAQIGGLARKVAKGLKQLFPVGSFIGACGLNSIEFAVADFACAMAGCVFVGVHTTYTHDAVLAVASNAQLVGMICCKAVVPSTGEPTHARHGLWSMQQLLPECTTIKTVVVMDGHIDEVALASVTVASMLDMVAPEDVLGVDAVDLGDLALLRGVRFDRDSCGAVRPLEGDGSDELHPGDTVFTLLYTSGSSGLPKGVVVSAEGFMNDIMERSFAEPLITVSYIPLSHSSDRMKMWEFALNGGRTGFAFYDASNWAAHESSKKDMQVVSVGSGENNVRGLFAQLTWLSPTAISCPPRIWNGLLHIYKDTIASAMVGSKSRADAEGLARDAVVTMFGRRRRIKFVATGGAATPPDAMSFAKSLFPHATVVDAYGTTESGGIASNGLPLVTKGVHVQLVDMPDIGFTSADEPHARGEIVVASPNMTLGYFRNAGATADAYLEGPVDTVPPLGPGRWYRTGDLGEFDYEGKLRVLERASSAACNVMGKVMFPGKIEAAIESCAYVAQAFVVVKPTLKSPIGVIVPRRSTLLKWLRDNPGHGKEANVERLAEVLPERLRAEMGRAIWKACLGARLLRSDVPWRLAVRLDDWNVDNGLLNGSLKKSRRLLMAHYSRLLDDICGSNSGRKRWLLPHSFQKVAKDVRDAPPARARDTTVTSRRRTDSTDGSFTPSYGSSDAEHDVAMPIAVDSSSGSEAPGRPGAKIWFPGSLGGGASDDPLSLSLSAEAPVAERVKTANPADHPKKNIKQRDDAGGAGAGEMASAGAKKKKKSSRPSGAIRRAKRKAKKKLLEQGQPSATMQQAPIEGATTAVVRTSTIEPTEPVAAAEAPSTEEQ